MSYLIRILLSFVLTSSLVFLGMFTWQKLYFPDHITEGEKLIQALKPHFMKALSQNKLLSLNQELDKLHFPAIISNQQKLVVSSNLGHNQDERVFSGQSALRENSNYIKKRLGPKYILYTDQEKGFEQALFIFPIIFSLFMGLIASVFVYLNGQKREELELVLIQLKDDIELQLNEEEIEELTEDIKQLKTKIGALEKELAASQTQNLALEQKVYDLKKESDQHLPELPPSAHTLDHLKAQEKQWQQQTVQLKSQIQYLKKSIQDIQSEQDEKTKTMANLRQDNKTIIKKNTLHIHEINTLHQRMKELEDISQQVYESYVLIHELQDERTKLKRSEQNWHKEKNKLIQILNEKDASINTQESKLEQAIDQLRKLSNAYKQKVELVHHLPTGLEDAKTQIEELIAEKDLIEKQNIDLQLKLGDKTSEINRLRRDIGIKKNKSNHLESHLKLLEGDFLNLHKELELLESTLLDKLIDLERLQLSYGNEKQYLYELIQARDHFKVSLQDLQDKYETIQIECQILTQSKQALQTQLDDIDIYKYQFQIEQLQQSVNMLTAQQKERTSAVQDTAKKLTQSTKMIRTLENYLSQKDERIQGLNHELERLQSILKIMGDKLDS